MTEQFTHSTIRKGREFSWLIKFIETLPELCEVLNMRHSIYSEIGYVTHEEITKRAAYERLMEALRAEGLDIHHGNYEVDDHDRVEDIIEGAETVGGFTGLTKIAMALKKDPEGSLTIDDRPYTLVAIERFVVDDATLDIADRLGLPMEPDFDISEFREQQAAKGRIIGETGRLIKMNSETPLVIPAMHRLVVNFAMGYAGNPQVPDNVITSQASLQSYYTNIGFSPIGEPFPYSKLGGDDWIPMHFDMERTRALVARELAGDTEATNTLKEMFPRPEMVAYFFMPIRNGLKPT